MQNLTKHGDTLGAYCIGNVEVTPGKQWWESLAVFLQSVLLLLLFVQSAIDLTAHPDILPPIHVFNR